ncbi:MAG: S8 family serine peptidase [Acidimicrobiia bacterium]|nr:S8 family serine peptidase [Acidimicrobiia bacterium]
MQATSHINTQGVTWIQRPGVTWIQMVGAVVTALALAATMIAPTGPAGDGGDTTVSFLAKPGSDGAAADGLTMDLVREFEADVLEALGFAGQGIDVALIDTGVAPVAGLDAPGKVLYGPDLSNEGELQNLATLDTYGHGTHIAGIIAGKDGTTDGFKGMAPDARIVSVKVAGATGETHIAQVIAAIDWVVEHKTRDGLNIRVLNLSLGRDGVDSSLNDPLSAAVERAWDAGIVVVVAAGNRNNDSNGLDSPAVSPYVIATGGLDGRAVRDGVATWSSGGDGLRDPDLVAPGASIVSLRVPGSALDQAYPGAVVDNRFMRGSGTSQSAAVMSGSIALLLSAAPWLTPDQVKYVLTNNANDVERRSTLLDGVGKVRPDTAAENVVTATQAPTQDHPRAMGMNDWDEISTWSGGTWSGATWSGGTWSGATWSGATWSGATWSGATWSGATWSGATWSGATWSGATWSGATWSGATWSGGAWSGVSWSSTSSSTFQTDTSTTADAKTFSTTDAETVSTIDADMTSTLVYAG